MTAKHKPLNRDQIIHLMEDCASSSRIIPLQAHMKMCEVLCRQYLDLLDSVKNLMEAETYCSGERAAWRQAQKAIGGGA